MPVAFRTCPLCEATCGLALEVDAAAHTVTKVRGDADDVLSHGFICPKGVSIKELHDDADRVRTPLVRQADGSFAPATWDEAFALIARRLPAIVEEHGRDAVGAYVGNPAAHSLAFLLYGKVLLKAIGTKQIFSASTVDQYPKQAASALLFGSGTTVAIPDLDRTDFLLCLGANPMASNGSLMTAPDVRGRLRAIRRRGGTIVVVDPRRSRTAREADEHLAIRPGTDALLLMALLHVVFDEGLEATPPSPHVSDDDLATVRALARDFAPEAVAPATGLDADAIRRVARAFATAPSAVAYGRIGTTTQAFGTTASWLIDVLNVVTGNLDRPGGAMFPLPAGGLPNTKGAPGRGRGAAFGRWTSRVRGLPEVFGELPAAALAEEIDTPGAGRIRALLTIAGNPVISTPNSARLATALDALDFMVSVDIYVNETTRHADVILPAPSPLEKAHFDLVFQGFSVRNHANWSPPVLPRPAGMPDEWRTVLRLVGVVTGQGPDADVAAIDDFVARAAIGKEVADERSPWHGRDVEDVLAELAPRTGTERMVDLLLRTGPYDLTLADLEARPHGVDLGPLAPRLPEVLRTPSGRVELAPPALVADVARLHDALDAAADADPGQLVLIGRRHLRSNNSWMHNLPLLVRGPERCTLHVHPDDAARLALVDGAPAGVRSRVGQLTATVEVTEDIRPGVVSLPHGWGHDLDGVAMGVARAHAGVNSNVLTDETAVEPLTGTAILNGIPVTLTPVAAPLATAG
ncbi:MAG TPA: molybdopterin-dependent oxidoreductase [Baekduia sp.]|uniref:molybdopterin-dependent oxidoreductase n=1 Tax=Baekduia sp. TaxID=2600305 RepID=UPI002D7929E9|nr:molybdopterin-dependent oxidoreductase [Baekduia sp.]HET6507542.1 molybdopterin-dependent oxidoreductase [Baekduia sp.]